MVIPTLCRRLYFKIKLVMERRNPWNQLEGTLVVMQRVILQHEGLRALTSKDSVAHVTCHSSLMFVNHCFFDFVRISRGSKWREQRRRGSTGWRFGLWLTHKHNEIRWLTHSAATLWCAVSTDEWGDAHRDNVDQNLLDGAGSVRVCAAPS